MTGRARVAVLVPARNAAADLPGWFSSVRHFADAVVALDDGSTDNTAELLAAEPLVRVLLHNPRRDSYTGWDDAANRQRLLDAAGDLDPDWILFLDADERIDPTDADALRAFLDTDALPGLAYGFRHLRMWGDRFDPSLCWVYRLFAYSPGQQLPDERLHFNPIPRTIPPPAYVPTTLRLQHLGAVDERRRRARLAKYREADPDGRWRTDFGGLHSRPERTEPWTPRPINAPVLVAAGRPDATLAP
jgi:glycosyltransferase involved in cell wall biosynthesis